MNRFYQYPNCKDFTLGNNEEVQLVIRRHWIVTLTIASKWLFWGPIVVMILSLFINFFTFPTEKNTELLLFSMSTLYFIFISFYYFIKWLNTTYDVIFITNDRVLDITQIDFWHRNIIETRLDHVQDATGDVKGVFNTLFDLGHIKIRTANDIADFSIDSIQGAHKKAREVFRLANKARKREIQGDTLQTGDFCPVDFSSHPKFPKSKLKITNIASENREVEIKQHQANGNMTTNITNKMTYSGLKKLIRKQINKTMMKKN